MFGNFQFGKPYFGQGQVPQPPSGGDITATLNVTLQSATLTATATVTGGSVDQSGPVEWEKYLSRQHAAKKRRKVAAPKVYHAPAPRTASLSVTLKSSKVSAKAILGPVPNIGRTDARLSNGRVRCRTRVFTRAKAITSLTSSTGTSQAVIRTRARSTITLGSSTVRSVAERGLSFDELMDEERIVNWICELATS